jgi:creatinine amidohydrolase
MVFWVGFCRICIIFSVAISLFPQGAYAAPLQTVFLEDMTWTELRDAVAAGKTTIIIPVGGTEQNGPLIALGKHNVRVKALAGEIAEALGNAIVAPVMAYVPEGNIDPPSQHMRFPGTISIEPNTFRQLLQQVASSVKQHGFKNIVLIGDHGGYQNYLAIVAGQLNRKWHGAGVRVVAIADYYAASQVPYQKALAAQGVLDKEMGSHAGLADTSLAMAIDPGLVRQSKLPQARQFGATDGVYGGDPTRSSATFGQLGVDIIVRQTVDAIRLAIDAK